ncbi:hypothetical protein BC939DRAFT_502342 [Gamsiella multidivaricata]|uniref:uncharacterized protein n=1 Tax=Gamsiella multidivaricata TaxID=101098 RepID=UPI002220E27B|nr:uncharacterized protein BC939DRAFT_502342 [Gamsiella multidivaricata]KAG0368901.1 hypothetical protein BGZ54_000877 [Gamsiella multidivaricata]KAI7825101.1 hypothetical protein BC939DRAFT_502342 [Gamsiella multidivaricata]
MRVLVLGGSGNVGKLVLQQLLARGHEVRAIIRTPENLPSILSSDSKLSVIKANLLDISIDDLASHVQGYDTVISTLGHSMNYGRVPGLGIWINPHDLVVRATQMVCDSINKAQPTNPIRFILLNTVGVINPDGSDTHVRSGFEKRLVSVMTAVLPPYADSVRSANYISKEVGTGSKYVEWTAVRPDGFIDGEISEYRVLDSIQHAFYEPDKITKANIAHFMCELVENPKTWEQWKFKMPVLIDTHQPSKE